MEYMHQATNCRELQHHAFIMNKCEICLEQIRSSAFCDYRIEDEDEGWLAQEDGDEGRLVP